MASGRIKGMFDQNGKTVKVALPSQPVTVMGLDEPPHAGDMFNAVKSVKEARAIVEERREQRAAAEARPAQAVSLEDIFNRFQAGEAKELLLIIKVDVYGSLEPVVNSVEQIKEGDLKVRVLHADVGEITESDVNLASASEAVIIGFNVGADSAAERLAEGLGVEIRTYNVIYKLIESVELALKGMLEPVYEDKTVGVRGASRDPLAAPGQHRRVVHPRRCGAA